MKIATFEWEGVQSWGFVLTNPDDGQEWVYEPEKCIMAFKTNNNGTNGYFRCLPDFWPGRTEWPKTVKAFLETGDEGMNALRKLEKFLVRYMEQSDPYTIACVGHPISDVRLRVPVPDTRLFLGLVQNSPSFFRARPERTHVNILPQAHQRSMTSVVGSGEVYLGVPGGNVEVGIVIGKECYNVPIEEAYNYVAGYVVVYDSQVADYYTEFDKSFNGDGGALLRNYGDWYADATTSWIGKGADSHCVCGPYITTTDEVGNPYDLDVATLTNGQLRDHSSTAGYLIGVERVVQYYSRFMTLHPGDIIHLGTVGTDGVNVNLDYIPMKDGGTVGAWMEKCGEIEAYVYYPQRWGDHRTEEMKKIPVVPTAQDFIDRGETEVDHFDIDNVRCVWTCFGNYKDVEAVQGWKVAPSPRMLNGPCGQLTDKQDDLHVSHIAQNLEISAEMAIVVKKLGKNITLDNAHEYVLGIAPVIGVCDMSIMNGIIPPASAQEANIGLDYGRWGDGYQTIGEVKDVPLAGRNVKLTVEGVDTVEGNTDEYVCGVERTLEFLTCATTMLPGDVITLGRMNKTVNVPVEAYKNGVKVTLEVEGFAPVTRTIYPAK